MYTLDCQRALMSKLCDVDICLSHAAEGTVQYGAAIALDKSGNHLYVSIREVAGKGR